MMYTLGILVLLLLLVCLVFIPKVRDFFISGKIFSQVIWLVLLVICAYFVLVLIQLKHGLSFEMKHGLPFHFINSNLSSEKIADSEWNWNLTYGFVVAFAGSVLIGGLLISIFNNMLERRIEHIEKGLVSYRFKNHYFFIGFDDIVIGLIRQIEKEHRPSNSRIGWLYARIKRIVYNDRCYLIQTTQNVEEIRHQLLSNLPNDIIHRIYILYKHLDSGKDARKLYVNRAKKIFVVGEQNSVDHDTVVVKTIRMLAEYRKKYINKTASSTKDKTAGSSGRQRKREKESDKFKRLECHVLFEFQSTCSVFQNKEISKNFKDYIDIRPFNFYDLWAQKLFVDTSGAEKTLNSVAFPGLDSEHITEPADKQVTLVIVGMSRMGVALAVKAMQVCHYANYEKAKTRIIFIDPDMERQKYIFESRYSALMESIDVYEGYDASALKAGSMSHYTDIALRFINDRVETPECRHFLSALAANEKQLLTVAICLNDPSTALAIGLYLPDAIYYTKTNILIRQETSESILQTMEIEDKDKYKRVYPFGMKCDCYHMELNDDLLPKLVNYIYSCSFEYDIVPEEKERRKDKNKFVDNLNAKWSGLVVKHKWSNYYNAEHYPTKIKIIKGGIVQGQSVVTEEDMAPKKELLARIEHNRWVIEKLLVGFRKVAPNKIAGLKKRKDICYVEKQTYRKLLLQKQVMELAGQSDVVTALEKQIRDQNEKCDRIWNEIKHIKKDIEDVYRHDCLVPFDELNQLDMHTDYVIAESIPWMQKWMRESVSK